MDDSLRQESELLRLSWERHDSAKLRDYLVAGVEDPRINLQSIFTRHFLIRAIADDWPNLMEHECRFSAVMNWLLHMLGRGADPDSFKSILHALEHNSDNAEGLEIPAFILESWRLLPASADGFSVPNYLLDFLRDGLEVSEAAFHTRRVLDTFCNLWRQALGSKGKAGAPSISVLEAACGSANDYRVLAASGIAQRIDYTGFDLSPKNVANARSLFPDARFIVGNAFQVDAPEKAFSLVFTHDLFEHLSPAGLETAVGELCRVTRLGLAVGFFSMDEIPEHIIRPLDDYHWSTLSMRKVRALFAKEGFDCRVIHVESFLREHLGCEHTHNPTAYTFFCWRTRSVPEIVT